MRSKVPGADRLDSDRPSTESAWTKTTSSMTRRPVLIQARTEKIKALMDFRENARMCPWGLLHRHGAVQADGYPIHYHDIEPCKSRCAKKYKAKMLEASGALQHPCLPVFLGVKATSDCPLMGLQQRRRELLLWYQVDVISPFPCLFSV